MKAVSIVKQIGVSGIVLFVVAISSYYLTANLRSTPDPEEYLPDDTVALVELNNLASAYTAFKSSPVGQELFSPDLSEKLQLMQISPDLQGCLVRFFSDIQRIGEHPLFTMISSRHSSLALLPAEYDVTSINEYFTKNSVLIAGLDLPFGQSNVFQKLLSKTFKSETFMYQGNWITRIYLQSGVSLYSAIIDRTFFCGFDPRPIERCAAYYNDRLLRPDSNLLHEEQYALLAGNSTSDMDFSLYADLEPLSFLLRKFNRLPVLNGLSDVDPGRFYLHHEKDDYLDKFSLTLHHSLAEKGNLFNTLFYQEPAVNRDLKRISDDTSAYIWTNWLDLQHLWDSLASTPSIQTATILFFIGQKIYEHTQLDIDTFTSMFGTEAGVFVRDVPSVADTRIPTICFQFQLRQPKEMKKFLKRMLNGVQTRDVEIDGYEAVAVMMAGGLIQPAYVMMDNELIVADSVEMLQQFVKLPERSLLESKSFVKVKDNVVNPGNFAAYGRVDKINRGLETLISWGLQALQRSGRLTGEQKESIDSTVVAPFFESMDHIHSQSVRIVNNGDQITLEAALYSSQDG